MPVRLEHIHQPTEADFNDLNKIHAETAPDGFRPDAASLQQFLADGGWIMAGRFNDRIIGAVLAKEGEQGVVISDAGVRAITQRRGVMHQMLHLMQRWADQQQQSLQLESVPDYLQGALTRRHFQLINGIFIYNPA
ncbi:acetyl-CoA sensor PanZ family protein [Thalassolituus sp. LLYu03]|uniref:acetyl-CoA sensor PanZ family protein n=1 Tax=Thalassolituus sp. LLYu03 TaxID=3421656 RepID=UPI003D286458